MMGVRCLLFAAPVNTRNCPKEVSSHTQHTPNVPPGIVRLAQLGALPVMKGGHVSPKHLWGQEAYRWPCACTLSTVRLFFMLPQGPCVDSMFLNQLCRYGYVTNSKVKFVMVVDSSNTALRDNEIRSVSAGSL